MRDLFLLLLFPIFIYYGIRTPIIGLYLWFWTSMYPMANWLYGIGLSLRFNLIFSAIAMGGYFMMKHKPPFKVVGLFVLVIVFFCHSGLGLLLYAQFYAPNEYQWRLFSHFSKIIIFFIFCVLLLRDKEHFHAILIFLTLALGFYGLMEGLKFIVTGGSHVVYGIKGPLGDNNKVALGLNMVIPLVFYLASQTKLVRIKQLFWGVAAGCIVAVLATDSRGGFLALAFMGAYYWWTTGKSFGILFFIIISVILAIYLLPDDWFARMNTIKDAGDSEGGLVSRITSWKINLLAAIDYPLTGLGFNATAFRTVWPNYAYSLDTINFFVETPVPTKGYVAHSIYFEVMGNQGLLGFFIYISVLLSAIFTINGMVKKDFPPKSWESDLLKAVKVSLYTFMVGGAALSAAYFELFYLLMSFIICLKIKVIIKNEEILNRKLKRNMPRI